MTKDTAAKPEAAKPDRSISESAPGSAVDNGGRLSLGQRQIMQLQRTIGNRRTLDLIQQSPNRPNVQRIWDGAVDERTNRQKIDEALNSRDVGGVHEIEDVTEAKEKERLTLIAILLNQSWVGPRDEILISKLWDSFGPDIERYAEFVPELWRKSVELGSRALPRRCNFDFIQEMLAIDVETVARHYLNTNEMLVETELAKIGLPSSQDPDVPNATDQQAQELKKLQEASDRVAQLQKLRELATSITVGYENPGDAPVPPQGFVPAIPVPFVPGYPPPTVPFPKDDEHPFVPYETVLDSYERAGHSIQQILSVYPLAYSIAREDNSGITKAFAETNDPQVARQALASATHKLLSDIRRTQKKLGRLGELNPLDLLPIHEKLYHGQITSEWFASELRVDWTSITNKTIAKKLTRDREFNVSLIDLGFNTIVDVTYLFASLAGGGAAYFIELAAVGALALKAKYTASEYEAFAEAARTQVKQGTDLVAKDQIDHRAMIADADSAAAAIAALLFAVGLGAKLVSNALKSEAEVAGKEGGTATNTLDSKGEAQEPAGSAREPNSGKSLPAVGNPMAGQSTRVTFQGTPVEPTYKNFQGFHGTEMPPDACQAAGGFRREGHFDLYGHRTDPNGSALLSLTTDQGHAAEHAVKYGEKGYVYVIGNVEGFDVNKIFLEKYRTLNPATDPMVRLDHEMEVAVTSPVPWDKVLGWYEIDLSVRGRPKVGRFVPNDLK